MLCDIIAGWVSGTIGIIASYPLDTVKVRQQTQGLSAVTCTKLTWKFEGVPGFIQGITSPTLVGGLANSLFVGAYVSALERFIESEVGVSAPTAIKDVAQQKKMAPYSHYFLAGCLGGAIQVVISCPMDVAKCKIQNQTGKSKLWTFYMGTHYNGPWHCLYRLFDDVGVVKGWYRGLLPMLLRDVPICGLQVTSTMWLIQNFGIDMCNPNPYSTSVAVLTGMAVWGISTPMDVIKTRMQSDSPLRPKYKNMRDCIYRSYAEHGYKVFFRGAFLNVVKAIPLYAATVISYDHLVYHCNARLGKKCDSIVESEANLLEEEERILNKKDGTNIDKDDDDNKKE